MYYSFYEKLVYERNNLEKTEEIRDGIGTYIRQVRLKKGLKQICVCQGICSISYFSRIENNRIKPSHQHLIDIFDKLDEELPQNYYFDHERDHLLLDEFLHALIHHNIQNMERIISEIDETHPTYHLLGLIYANFLKQTDTAKHFMRKIYQYKDVLSDFQLEVLLYSTANHYFITREHEKAQRYLDLAFYMMREGSPILGLVHYLYAKVLSRLRLHSKASTYIKKAIVIFEEQCIYHYIMRGQLFLAIEQLYRYPDSSIKQLRKMVASEEVRRSERIYLICMFCLAKAYIHLKHYKKRYSVFQEVHSQMMQDPEILIEYIYLLILMEELEKACEMIDYLEKELFPSPRVKHLLTYCRLMIEKGDLDKHLTVLEHKLIPFAIVEHDYFFERVWRLEAINLLEKKNYHKEANSHYRSLIEIFDRLSTL